LFFFYFFSSNEIFFKFYGGILVSWTPYAFVSLYRAFINGNEVSPLAATIPFLFAKLSLAWPAIFCLFGNSDVRRKLLCIEERLQEKNRQSIVRKFQ
jgi:hypothetical protein